MNVCDKGSKWDTGKLFPLPNSKINCSNLSGPRFRSCSVLFANGHSGSIPNLSKLWSNHPEAHEVSVHVGNKVKALVPDTHTLALMSERFVWVPSVEDRALIRDLSPRGFALLSDRLLYLERRFFLHFLFFFLPLAFGVLRTQ